MSEEQKMLFINLVIMLGSSTMQSLGKIVNPATQKAEINLESAQAMIDLLDMLEAKTRNNLDAEESRFLKATLADLKLNYVECSSGAAAPQNEAPQKETPPKDAPPKDKPIENKRFSKKFD